MRAMKMRLSLLLAAVVGSGALACTEPSDLPFEPADSTHAPDPSKFGPFPVGVRTIELTDEERIDIATNKPRRLVVEIWYPAVEDARGKPGATYDVTQFLNAEQKKKLADDGVAVPLLETSAVRDATPRKNHGPYPLVVFSHGHGGLRWQSTFYTVALASHGYVVVSPDHSGDTLDVILATGELPSILAGYEERTLDARFLLDAFTKNLPGSDPLTGLINKDQIGVTGHSFGALTSMRTAFQDPRVKAIVPQAPTDSALALVGAPLDYILQTPTMIEGAGKDRTLPYQDNVVPAFKQMGKPKSLLNIVNGGHFTFSDLCQFDMAKLAAVAGFNDVNVTQVITDGCGPEAPKASIAQPLMNNFAIGWFNIHLRGSAKSWDYISQARSEELAPSVAISTTER
jgi:predicted dienelactone hydrolase